MDLLLLACEEDVHHAISKIAKTRLSPINLVNNRARAGRAYSRYEKGLV